MVFNALEHIKKYGTHENVPRQKRARKTSRKTDKEIVRTAKKDPMMTSEDIRKELLVQPPISARTIRRRLNEAQLFGRVSRKKPLLTKKNRRARLKFARDHLLWGIDDWKKILWSDETKINRVGSDGRVYVRRPKGKENDPRYTTTTLKHGGGNIKLWGCFSWRGVGPLAKIEGIMDQEKYKEILENHMLPFAEENLPITWMYQQDNDPKHTARSVKRWFEDNFVTVIEWPSCSPDLNPIENLWFELKRSVKQEKIKNMKELEEIAQQKWSLITPRMCQHLIESMPRRCRAVIDNKGYPTKY